jgi:hypothetical protein
VVPKVREELRAFAKTTQDFYDARKGLLDTPEVDYYTEKNSIHSDTYCAYKFFQPPTSQLGANYVKTNLERRGRKAFRIGCKPRREVGKGKRMCSGVGKVGNVRGVFDLYRSGKGNSWACNDGAGELLLLFFTVSGLADNSDFEGLLEDNGVFKFELCIDDLYRCVRRAKRAQTALGSGSGVSFFCASAKMN